jgi:hypothetical protein
MYRPMKRQIVLKSLADLTEATVKEPSPVRGGARLAPVSPPEAPLAGPTSVPASLEGPRRIPPTLIPRYERWGINE